MVKTKSKKASKPMSDPDANKHHVKVTDDELAKRNRRGSEKRKTAAMKKARKKTMLESADLLPTVEPMAKHRTRQATSRLKTMSQQCDTDSNKHHAKIAAAELAERSRRGSKKCITAAKKKAREENARLNDVCHKG